MTAGPSALLVTLDTTRFDAVGFNLTGAAHTPALSPHLDALAADAVVFERAHTVAPLTLPSHASMLTGLYPPRHAVRSNGPWALPEDARTLAERAREAGLETAAFVSAVVLAEAFGLDQGFARYDRPPYSADREDSSYAERSARATVAAARTWLEGLDPGARYFLWVHLWEPHAPYAPPPEQRGRTPSPYLDEVRTADAALGELFAFLRERGDWEDLVVLVVADHGEAFGEHGETTHGSYCYDTTLRVPLLLRMPGGVGGDARRDARIASVADVAPTLLEALGLEPERGIDGRSLLAPPEAGRGVYFETYYGYLNHGWSPLTGWLDAGGKYLHSSRPQFFDLGADPEERVDLADRTDLAPYRAALARLGALPALEADDAAAGALRGALQDLGYASFDAERGALPPPLHASERPSPAERADEHALLLRALDLTNAGRYATAEALYADVLATNPANREARENQAFCMLRQHRFESALEAYRALADSGDASARALTYLGVCLRAMGHAEEALTWYERALARDPHEVEALWQARDLLRSLGRNAEAAAYDARLTALESSGP